MKRKLPFGFLLFLILWSVLSIGFYFFAAAMRWEAVMHVYLIGGALLGALYLFVDSPAVATKGEQEQYRKRKAWITLEQEQRKMLSRLFPALALPMLFAFLLDYLMILWNVSPL